MSKMLRRPPQGFWRDTLHAAKIGLAGLAVATFCVAVVYADRIEAALHQAAWRAVAGGVAQ